MSERPRQKTMKEQLEALKPNIQTVEVQSDNEVVHKGYAATQKELGREIGESIVETLGAEAPVNLPESNVTYDKKHSMMKIPGSVWATVKNISMKPDSLEFVMLSNLSGERIGVWSNSKEQFFVKVLDGQEGVKDKYRLGEFGQFLFVNGYKDTYGYEDFLKSKSKQKKLKLDANGDQVKTESAPIVIEVTDTPVVPSEEVTIEEKEPIVVDTVEDMEKKEIALMVDNDVAVEAEPFIAKSSELKYILENRRFQGKRTDDEMVELIGDIEEASRRVIDGGDIEEVIASLGLDKDSRVSKTLKKDIPNALAAERAAYENNNAGEIISLMTSEEVLVSKDAEKPNADANSVTYEDFVREIQTRPGLAELSSVEEDFLGDSKNTDFLHLGLKKPKVEASLDQVRDNAEEQKLFDEKNNRIEELREKMVSVRQAYAQMDHKKTGMIDNVKRFFGESIFKSLSKDEDLDVIEMRARYQNALMDYQNARLEQVRESSATQEALKVGLVEVLKEMEIEEGMNLYSARTDVKAESFSGKMLDGVTLSVDWYRNFYKSLSTPGKIIFSGTLLTAGVGLSAGASLGVAGAGAGFWALKAFTGVSSGRGLFDMMETLVQNNRKKKDEQAIESFSDKVVDIDIAEVSRRLDASAMSVDEKLNKLMRGRAWRSAAGVLIAGLPIGISAYNAGIEALHSSSSFENVVEKSKEIGGAVHEKVHAFLDTYTNHGSESVASSAVHSKGISIPIPAAHVAFVAERVSVPIESVVQEMTQPATVAVEKSGTVIESLRHLKMTGLHSLEAWKEYVASNASNPFAVSEKFTMPGAQVLVDHGKITDIVDKQGVLLGTMREFSGGHPSVWREIKDMSLDQVRDKHPEMYRKMIESIAKYQEYLSDNMPALKPEQSMKQWAAGLAKAYTVKKGWA